MKAIRITSTLLAIARILSCFMAVILIFVLLIGGSTGLTVIHAYKLEFAHINIAKGLYSALKQSSNQYSSTKESSEGDVDPFQPDVTTAEIQILIEYMIDQFQGKPEFIVAGVNKYCYGGYQMRNITRGDLGKPFTHVPHSQIEVVSRCGHYTDEEFNYREMLLAEGLDIILDYAYQGNIYGSMNSKSYQRVVFSTRVFQTMLLSILPVTLILQFIILILTFHNIRQRKQLRKLERANDQRKSSDMSIYNHANGRNNINSSANLDKESTKIAEKAKKDKAILKVNSILSTISMLLFLVLGIYYSAVLINLRSQVNSELGDFGFKLLGGRIFIIVLWVIFLCMFISFILWFGVLFLVVPNQNDQYALRAEFSSDSEFQNNLEIIKNREREYTFINQYSSDKDNTGSETTTSTKNEEIVMNSVSSTTDQSSLGKTNTVEFMKNKSMSRSAGNYRKSLQNLAAFAGESRVTRNMSPSLEQDIRDINSMTLLNRNTSIGTNVFSMKSSGNRNMTLDLTNTGFTENSTENSTFLNTGGSQIDTHDQLKYYREPKQNTKIKFVNPFEDP